MKSSLLTLAALAATAGLESPVHGKTNLVSSKPAVSAAPDPSSWFWRYIARRDLSAARDAIAENTPILHVRRDSKLMRSWLQSGFKKAEQMLPMVSDETSYRFLIEYFLRGFRDGHISHLNHDGYRPKPIPTKQWPGLALAWTSNGYAVAHVAPFVSPKPLIGSTLLDCDGRSAEAISRERIDLFEADLDKPLQRRRSAFRLLWDRGNPFVQPLSACRFESGGVVSKVKLDYQVFRPSEELDAIMSAATTQAGPEKLELTRFHDFGWRIAIPSMGASQNWDDLFASISTNIDELRSSSFVVIDLRGNGGGSSAFADRLANQIWGKNFVDAHRRSQGPVAWRASSSNLATFQALIYRFESNSTEADNLPSLKKTVAGLSQAIAAKRSMYIEAVQTAPTETKSAVNPVSAKVILLTDERCFSACLDLMDLFTTLPNVIQAGKPTGADTIFMDMSYATLPSGKLQIGYGTKAWVERPRGSNVPYSPSAAWTFTGTDANDEAWSAWLSSRLRSVRARSE